MNFNRWDAGIVTAYVLGRYIDYLGWLELSLILRFYDVAHIYEEMEEKYRLREKIEGLSDMFRLVVFIIYMAHFLACSWYYVARV